jgi:MtN3 and saliva related transmembrane protein
MPTFTTVLAVSASAWGVAMALSPMLQIRTMVAHRSSRGISLGYLLVLLVGFVLWLGYGLALGNLAIIVPNAVAFLTGAATIAVVRHYRSGDSSTGTSRSQ